MSMLRFTGSSPLNEALTQLHPALEQFINEELPEVACSQLEPLIEKQASATLAAMLIQLEPFLRKHPPLPPEPTRSGIPLELRIQGLNSFVAGSLALLGSGQHITGAAAFANLSFAQPKDPSKMKQATPLLETFEVQLHLGSVTARAEILAMVSQEAVDKMQVDQFQEFDCLVACARSGAALGSEAPVALRRLQILNMTAPTARVLPRGSLDVGLADLCTTLLRVILHGYVPSFEAIIQSSVTMLHDAMNSVVKQVLEVQPPCEQTEVYFGPESRVNLALLLLASLTALLGLLAASPFWSTFAWRSQRTQLLVFLDEYGKYSLVDSWLAILALCAFDIKWKSEEASVNVMPVPMLPFFTFVVASVFSLVLGHVATVYNRRSLAVAPLPRSLSRELQEEELHVLFEDLPLRQSWQLLLLTLFSGLSLLVSCFLSTIQYQVSGVIADLLLEEEQKELSYSLITLGSFLTTGFEASTGLRTVQFIFFSFTVAIPLALVGTLLALLLWPMTRPQQKRLLKACHVLDAWAAFDVFVLAVVVANFEFWLLTEFLMYHDNIAAACHWVHQNLNAECLAMQCHVLPGFILMAFAGIASYLTPKIYFQLCEVRSPPTMVSTDGEGPYVSIVDNAALQADDLGKSSANAQGLRKPVTSGICLGDQRVYLLLDGRTALGFLKVVQIQELSRLEQRLRGRLKEESDDPRWISLKNTQTGFRWACPKGALDEIEGKLQKLEAQVKEEKERTSDLPGEEESEMDTLVDLLYLKALFAQTAAGLPPLSSFERSRLGTWAMFGRGLDNWNAVAGKQGFEVPLVVVSGQLRREILRSLDRKRYCQSLVDAYTQEQLRSPGQFQGFLEGFREAKNRVLKEIGGASGLPSLKSAPQTASAWTEQDFGKWIGVFRDVTTSTRCFQADLYFGHALFGLSLRRLCRRFELELSTQSFFTSEQTSESEEVLVERFKNFVEMLAKNQLLGEVLSLSPNLIAAIRRQTKAIFGKGLRDELQQPIERASKEIEENPDDVPPIAKHTSFLLEAAERGELRMLSVSLEGKERILMDALTFGVFLQDADDESVRRLIASDDYVASEVAPPAQVGRKRLFVEAPFAASDWADVRNAFQEIQPLCALDFYIHERYQRSGFGRQLFDAMLAHERSSPERATSGAGRELLGYDRPSPKLLSFLSKHYGLRKYKPQNNNFVVYDDFWSQAERADPRADGRAADLRTCRKRSTRLVAWWAKCWRSSTPGTTQRSKGPLLAPGGASAARATLAADLLIVEDSTRLAEDLRFAKVATEEEEDVYYRSATPRERQFGMYESPRRRRSSSQGAVEVPLSQLHVVAAQRQLPMLLEALPETDASEAIFAWSELLVACQAQAPELLKTWSCGIGPLLRLAVAVPKEQWLRSPKEPWCEPSNYADEAEGPEGPTLGFEPWA
eukprot:g1842.t2